MRFKGMMLLAAAFLPASYVMAMLSRVIGVNKQIPGGGKCD